MTTVEVALVAYTLLILYRNILEGFAASREEVCESARGMGLTTLQTLVRVELPLATPSIVAGLRIATVSTISIATIAAFVIPEGLGRPIFIAIAQDIFKTEIIAAGGLTILLALAADALLVVARPLADAVEQSVIGGHIQLGDVPRRDPLHRRPPAPALGQDGRSISSSPAPRSGSRSRSRCRSASSSATSTAARSSRSASRTSAARCRASS